MTDVAGSAPNARGRRLLVAALATVIVAGACAPLSESVASRDSAPVNVLCGSSTYNAAFWRDAPPASSMPPGAASAVDSMGAPAFDPSEPWRIVHQSDRRVDIVRELDRPVDEGGGDVRTHAARTLQLSVGSANVADGTWQLTSAATCAQRVVRDDGLGPGNVALAEPVSRADTTIMLAVVEHACASGQPADGRVVVDVAESEEWIALTVGVRPAEGDQQCPGNPVTSVGVELDAPVANRYVVDAAVVPARPLAAQDR